MYERMRGWSRGRRTAFILAVIVSSSLLRYLVARLTDSAAATLVVNVVLLIALAWLVVTWFRVLLKESEEAIKKNPRPW